MIKKIISVALAAATIANLAIFSAEAKVNVWSFYETAGYYPVLDDAKGSGWDYGDITDKEYFVEVKPVLRTTNNTESAVLVQKGASRPAFYIRPEYEWDVKIADYVKDRCIFYLTTAEKSDVGMGEIVVSFTVPKDGLYKVYTNIINDFGTAALEGKSDKLGDGGLARLTVVKKGETLEKEENSTEIEIPAMTGDAPKEVEINKEAENFNKGDKILLRMSCGDNGEGDIFQTLYRISEVDEDENIIKTYDLRDLADDSSASADVQTVVDKSVAEGERTKIGDSKYAKALAELGVISTDEVGLYSMDKEITRAEFAGFLAKALNMGDMPKKRESKYFTDVSESDEPQFIDALAEAGVIAQARLFRPTENVKFDEAIKMMVSALGYGRVADINGGYPNGYLKIAYDCDIISGNRTEELTKSQASRMIYDFVNAPLLTVEAVENGQLGLVQKDEKTILTEKYDIYKDKGIVTDIPFESLYSGKTIGRGMVKINDVEYKTDLNVSDLLGYKVKYYYKDSDIPELLSYEIVDDGEKLIIDRRDLVSINYKEIVYNTDTKEKKIKFDENADIIYNGKSGIMTGNLEDYINGDSQISLIDRNGDRAYDVISISTYENLVVSYVDKKNYIVTDRIDKKQTKIDAESADIIFYNADGNEVSFDSIKENSVLSIYKNLGGDVVKVVVSDKVISGVVQSVKDENDCVVVFIDGIGYYVSQSFINIGTYEVGTGTTFYIDAKDRIAYTKLVPTESFGYLLRFSQDDNDPDNMAFRIINSKGQTVEYTAAKYVLFNGIKATREELKVKQQIEYPTKNTFQGVVYYKARGNEIKEITMQDELETKTYAKGLKYHSGSAILGGSLVIDENTLLFTVPEQENEITVSNAKTSLVHFASYSGLTSVKLDADDVISDVIVQKGSAVKALDEYQYPLLVSAIEPIIVDDDDNIVQKVTGYRNGSKVEYFTEKENTLQGVKGFATGSADRFDVDVGDIILTTVRDNIIQYAEIDFDASSKRKIGPNDYTDYFGRPHIFYKSIYSKNGNYLRVTEDVSTVADANDLEIQGINRVYIIDLNAKKKVVEGTYNDLIAYDKNPTNYTRAVFSTMEVPDAIYIYR